MYVLIMYMVVLLVILTFRLFGQEVTELPVLIEDTVLLKRPQSNFYF